MDQERERWIEGALLERWNKGRLIIYPNLAGMNWVKFFSEAQEVKCGKSGLRL